MPSQTDKTLLVSLPPRPVDEFDRSIFPLAKIKGQKHSLQTVDLILVATMDELVKMKHMVKNTAEFKTFIHDSKLQYDELLENKESLAEAMAKKTFNPFKLLSTYRAVRLLTEAGMAMWTETKSKSEKLRRLSLSESVNAVNTRDIQPVGDDDLSPGACISAIAIPLETETNLDETVSFFSQAVSFIGSQVGLIPDRNPFSDAHKAEDSRTNAVPEDSSVSYLSADDGSTSPTSSSSHLSETSSSTQGSGNTYLIFQQFQNSFVASESAIHSPTLNQGGSHNQGSSSR
ncbi:hypothetical protein CY34DRAFT_806286 [Suillus luteus UH-Slu-Lm8-n1]|uniref:Uncharacterized protein n=1 Tax=Suillus luteus UH-Slu-Lm8-n1 TaxID=930992 RepID=A0A0D0BCW2_9AGAM|nr:hypothetical protein CY34DRAFT_806286 [Suillus luteus UH-Slu-Lm8-n1]